MWYGSAFLLQTPFPGNRSSLWPQRGARDLAWIFVTISRVFGTCQTRLLILVSGHKSKFLICLQQYCHRMKKLVSKTKVSKPKTSKGERERERERESPDTVRSSHSEATSTFKFRMCEMQHIFFFLPVSLAIIPPLFPKSASDYLIIHLEN